MGFRRLRAIKEWIRRIYLRELINKRKLVSKIIVDVGGFQVEMCGTKRKTLPGPEPGLKKTLPGPGPTLESEAIWWSYLCQFLYVRSHFIRKKEPKSASRRLNKLKKRVLKSFLDEILNYRSAGPLSGPGLGPKQKF
jgi:hypothetical protein